MLREFLLRHQKISPSSMAGERVYAIGDIHGRADLFRQLLGEIQRDGKLRGRISTRIILLGDLIDRGPSSKMVIDLVRKFQSDSEAFVVLCGNHEEMLLESAAGNGTVQNVWLKNGGLATLFSYGIERSSIDGMTPAKLGKLITRTVGEDTLKWLRSLPLTFRSGDYYFCHAGIRPGIALDKQGREDLLWIRDDFLDSTEYHGAVIVHGHSEQVMVEEKTNRINVDTAAYRTGFLTSLAIEGTARWFIEAGEK